MSGVRRDLLAVYLNDHLAGAAGGVALARRVLGSHRDAPYAPELDRLATEIAADRDSLVAIVDRLGITRTRYKEPLALIAERLGRLKLNGSLVQRSPLSDLVEFEAMLLGVSGKRAGWRTLRELATHLPELDVAELDGLIARADAQLELLQRLHDDAAGGALVS